MQMQQAYLFSAGLQCSTSAHPMLCYQGKQQRFLSKRKQERTWEKTKYLVFPLYIYEMATNYSTSIQLLFMSIGMNQPFLRVYSK
jgi:hypothetical protein